MMSKSMNDQYWVDQAARRYTTARWPPAVITPLGETARATYLPRGDRGRMPQPGAQAPGFFVAVWQGQWISVY
jgi:hypothetical protein